MTRLRRAALDWVERTIANEWPEEQRSGDLAETLVAIAEHYRVPDEVLIQWIHLHAPVPAQWRRECEEYAETRRNILESARNAPEQRTLLDLPKMPSGFDPQ